AGSATRLAVRAEMGLVPFKAQVGAFAKGLVAGGPAERAIGIVAAGSAEDLPRGVDVNRTPRGGPIDLARAKVGFEQAGVRRALLRKFCRGHIDVDHPVCLRAFAVRAFAGGREAGGRADLGGAGAARQTSLRAGRVQAGWRGRQAVLGAAQAAAQAVRKGADEPADLCGRELCHLFAQAFVSLLEKKLPGAGSHCGAGGQASKGKQGVAR
ncbi:unnamed protein product, partial [Symbiodinium sp. CCMP2456]